ncbi:gp53-like domain-containing protein [Citrobacter braakii]|uniref:gp53-like domain-containing protein n=1 Tax=Citrobacter braakii TaxID=57706 RepID=UPI003B01A5AE
MLRIGQVEATATQDGKYTDGSVAGGIAATRLRAAAFNAMQEELAHIVESAGLALDINDMTQVLKAIQKLTLSRANPFADIKSDGAAAISTALTNLGLSDLVLAGVGGGSLGTTGYAEIPLVISGAKKMLLLCWGIGSTGSNGSFTQSFAKAFPTAVLCKLVTNSASTSPSGFAGASTTLSTISIYSASAASTASSSGLSYNYLAIGY